MADMCELVYVEGREERKRFPPSVKCFLRAFAWLRVSREEARVRLHAPCSVAVAGFGRAG